MLGMMPLTPPPSMLRIVVKPWWSWSDVLEHPFPEKLIKNKSSINNYRV
jgi:hypothetical protein